MFRKKQKEAANNELLAKLLTEVEALRTVSVRTETRLCKLIEHQGATKALAHQPRHTPR